jgi:Protein of unknown function (DUF1573)
MPIRNMFSHMKKNLLTTLIFASATSIFMISCSDKTTSKDVDAEVVTNIKTADNPNAENPEPILTCDKSTWEFGRINEGEIVLHTFSFTNTGNEALVINKCQASCGCTTPTCDKKPIPPGGSGIIKIRFDSNGKKNNQTKNVTVTANTNPPETILTITGFVIPKEG